MKKNKAFTLIELIAVLVILAILALIVTPLVMNIIKKARISADKRSIDAYGRSIELAIATYLLDEGRFPTSISDLTIEYSGDEVVCSQADLNSDSTIYLTGCTVAGRAVDYEYRTQRRTQQAVTYDAYEIGDEVTYNSVDYYVIENSDSSEANVTLLKAEPLTVAEVNQYGGVGTANNHVNIYVTENTSSEYYQTASNVYDSGYGGMAYYSSSTCGRINNNDVGTGCITDYAQSEVKYVVDAWKADQALGASLARLITLDDLKDNLGYDLVDNGSVQYWTKTESTPTWAYSSSYTYWTMSPVNDSLSSVWEIGGNIGTQSVYNYYRAVRPVIVLPKSALN